MKHLFILGLDTFQSLQLDSQNEIERTIEAKALAQPFNKSLKPSTLRHIFKLERC